MAKLFSERYGYVKPTEALIIESMPPEVVNSICNCYDEYVSHVGREIEKTIWTEFLNERLDEFRNEPIFKYTLEDGNNWLNKLDLLDFVLQLIYSNMDNPINQKAYFEFSVNLNRHFKRLNYGYRIVDGFVVPITSHEEIESIEEAIEGDEDNIKKHLKRALALMADKKSPDYRNSIKESISAVESLLRKITGESTLGQALKKMENDKNLRLHSTLKSAFEKLYLYTNNGATGARHSLMDDTNDYIPTYEEAKFMIVACSAFINYVSAKFEVNASTI